MKTLIPLFVWLACLAPLRAEVEPRPNLIVLLADDLGWRDLGHAGREVDRRHEVRELDGLEPLGRHLANLDAVAGLRADGLRIEHPLRGLDLARQMALHGLAARPDSRPTLAEIRVPTLVLVGEEDAITPPAEAEAMASEIHGSQLVVVPRAGHLASLEQPEAVNAAVSSFLVS